MSQRSRRIRTRSQISEYDREIVASARDVIDRSWELLRESSPETYLGRNYYAPTAPPFQLGRGDLIVPIDDRNE